MRLPVSALRRLLQVLAVAAVFFTVVREARAEEVPLPVILYTIGPTDELASRFGHSFLCLRESGKDTPEGGHCYDYGVPSENDITRLIWSAVRNRPSFTAVRIDESAVLAFFRNQGRQVERQRILLPLEQAQRLGVLLDTDVVEKRTYAYHPYWSNCATKLRDHLDTATGGRLRRGPTQVPPGVLREYMEDGQSGHLGILMAMALLLGDVNEHVPTPWEAMLLPTVLRDGVAARFDAPPEKLDERIAVVLPTSRAIGRLAIFGLGFLLLVVIRVLAQRNKVRLSLMIVGGTFFVIAVAIEVAAALVKWPEISHNWALLLFLPTDVALPYLTGRRLALYARVRIAMACVFAVLELANVIHQPMLPLAALIVLPMAGILSVLKDRETSAKGELPAPGGA